MFFQSLSCSIKPQPPPPHNTCHWELFLPENKQRSFTTVFRRIFHQGTLETAAVPDTFNSKQLRQCQCFLQCQFQSNKKTMQNMPETATAEDKRDIVVSEACLSHTEITTNQACWSVNIYANSEDHTACMYTWNTRHTGGRIPKPSNNVSKSCFPSFRCGVHI